MSSRNGRVVAAFGGLSALILIAASEPKQQTPQPQKPTAAQSQGRPAAPSAPPALMQGKQAPAAGESRRGNGDGERGYTLEDFSFLATVAQAFIGVAGLVGLVFTVLYAKAAWMAAEKSARAADDTYKAMLDGERRQLRAYLYVMNNTTPTFEGEGVLEGRFLLKNAGQTPALKVRTVNAMSIGRRPFQGDPPALPEEMFEGGGVLAPGATMRLVCRINEPPTPVWRQALINKTHAVCMYGEIRYEDIFGEEHVTTYRAMYGGQLSEDLDEILWCRDGNEAT